MRLVHISTSATDKSQADIASRNSSLFTMPDGSFDWGNAGLAFAFCLVAYFTIRVIELLCKYSWVYWNIVKDLAYLFRDMAWTLWELFIYVFWTIFRWILIVVRWLNDVLRPLANTCVRGVGTSCDCTGMC